MSRPWGGRIRSAQATRGPDPGEDRDSLLNRFRERAEDIVATHRPAAPQDRLEEVRRYVAKECAARGRR